MRGLSKPDEAPGGPVTLSGWLGELATSGQLRAPQAPVGEHQRVTLVAQIDAQLPPDHLEFMEQVDGARVGECKIYGLGGVRKVALPGGNYYILAEIGDEGELAVKHGSRHGELYRLSYERDEVQPLNQTFKIALAELCCKSKRFAIAVH